MLSHIIQLFYIDILQVISEEHDETNTPPKLTKLDSNCKALKHVFKTEWVSSDSITIWIDPLDATKEYTGLLAKYHFQNLYYNNFYYFTYRKSFGICYNHGVRGC